MTSRPDGWPLVRARPFCLHVFRSLKLSESTSSRGRGGGKGGCSLAWPPRFFSRAAARDSRHRGASAVVRSQTRAGFDTPAEPPRVDIASAVLIVCPPLAQGLARRTRSPAPPP